LRIQERIKTLEIKKVNRIAINSAVENQWRKAKISTASRINNNRFNFTHSSEEDPIKPAQLLPDISFWLSLGTDKPKII
jgi:hypothetical protein